MTTFCIIWQHPPPSQRKQNNFALKLWFFHFKAFSHLLVLDKAKTAKNLTNKQGIDSTCISDVSTEMCFTTFTLITFSIKHLYATNNLNECRHIFCESSSSSNRFISLFYLPPLVCHKLLLILPPPYLGFIYAFLSPLSSTSSETLQCLSRKTAITDQLL